MGHSRRQARRMCATVSCWRKRLRYWMGIESYYAMIHAEHIHGCLRRGQPGTIEAPAPAVAAAAARRPPPPPPPPNRQRCAPVSNRRLRPAVAAPRTQRVRTGPPVLRWPREVLSRPPPPSPRSTPRPLRAAARVPAPPRWRTWLPPAQHARRLAHMGGAVRGTLGDGKLLGQSWRLGGGCGSAVRACTKPKRTFGGGVGAWLI